MIGLALALLLQAGAAPETATAAPTPPAGPPITRPVWIRRPDGRDMAKAFPKAAEKEALEGAATISCHVTAQGVLADCVVLVEHPEGSGFGAAALRLAPLFKMRPTAKDGQAVEGGVVRIPIRFVLPPDIQAGPVTAHDVAHTGVRVEVNCRYRGQQLDNCRGAEAGDQPPGATQAAIYVAQGLALPPMPRPMGRVIIPIQFDGDPPARKVISAPTWVRQPNAADIERVIPATAMQKNVSGDAVISCKVIETGELDECVVVQESPIGAGFGAAALKLSERFQLSPKTPDGQSVAGGTVRIPLRFIAH